MTGRWRHLITAALLSSAGLVAAAPAAAQGVADLGTWNGSLGFGGTALDRLGASAATGDFDGDGLWDLALGAPGARSNAGDVYLFLGSSLTLDESFLADPASAADLVLEGEAGAQLGTALHMGDVNGDGLEDLIAGAPFAASGRGEVWIFFGTPAPPGTATAPDTRILGANAGDEFGAALGTALLSGDPIQDLVVGSPAADPLQRDAAGRVDLLAGRTTWPAQLDLAASPGFALLFGVQNGSRAGSSIARTVSFGGTLLGGDLDGDGNGDLAFGAPGRRVLARVNAGAVHHFASSESLEDTVDLAGDGLLRYRLLAGAVPYDETGRSLAFSRVGTRRSLLVGAPNAYISGIRGGAVYEVNWAGIVDDGPIVDLAVNANFVLKLVSNVAGDRLGQAVAGLGDLWAAGLPGLAPWTGAQAGGALLLPGPPTASGVLPFRSLAAGQHLLLGATGGDEMGAVAALGDFDDDTLLDGLLASPRATSYAGRAHIVRGGLPWAWDFEPAPGQTGVSVSSSIRFLAADPEGSLAADQAVVTVSGTSYDGGDPELTWNGSGELLYELQPPNPFPLNVPIPVTVRLQDQGGNSSPLHGWQFVTGVDDRAPEVGSLSPYAGEAGVATTRDVQFTLLDQGEGVDTASVSITIQGEEVGWGDPRLSATGPVEELLFVYSPYESFPAEAQIAVTLRAADLVEPDPNVMAPYHYVFYTSSDTVPPEVTQINPPPGATIDVSTTIRALLVDASAGVDPDATEMVLYEGGPGRPAPLEASALPGGLLVSHDPTLHQLYATGVLTVSLASADLAEPPNLLDPPYEWNYTVVEDTAPPELLEANPAPGSSGAPRNTPVRLTVIDRAAGVDSLSLGVTINGQVISQEQLAWTTVRTTSYRGWEVRYTPPPTVPWEDTVSVEVTAADLATTPNELATQYSFTTTADSTAPTLLLVDPPAGASGVQVTDSLVWEAVDDLTGVDPGSAFLAVDSVDRTSELVASSFTTLPAAEQRFVYRPASGFSYEDTVAVLFGVADYSTDQGGPNVRTTSYALYTEPDEDPPYLATRRPFPGETGVSRSADILFQVKDRGIGVERDSLALYVQGDPAGAANLQVSELDSGFQVRYDPPGLFDYQDTVGVRVVAWDRARDPNRMVVTEQEWWFVTLQDDREAPYLDDLAPPDSASGVAVEAPLAFSLLDEGTGVDSLFTRVTRPARPGFDFRRLVEPISLGYRYTLLPPEEGSWTWSDTMTFEVRARDLAEPANRPGEPLRYTVLLRRDDDPVQLLDREPPPDSVGVFGSPLSLLLADPLAGVDTSALELEVNGGEVTGAATLAEEVGGWRLRYHPSPPWPAGETVQVRVATADLSATGNRDTTGWSFTVAPDTVAPLLVADSLHPPPGAEEVALDDTIRVLLADPGIGLDRASVELVAAGRSYGGEQADSVAEGLRFTVPLEDLPLFAGQQVTLIASASDRADPPNVLEPQSWSWTLAPPEDDFAVVPTTFTPNGDGVWDEVLIHHGGGAGTEATFFDLRGRVAATRRGAPVRWDGRDDDGEPVPGGLYLVQLEVGGSRHQAQIAVAR